MSRSLNRTVARFGPSARSPHGFAHTPSAKLNGNMGGARSCCPGRQRANFWPPYRIIVLVRVLMASHGPCALGLHHPGPCSPWSPRHYADHTVLGGAECGRRVDANSLFGWAVMPLSFHASAFRPGSSTGALVGSSGANPVLHHVQGHETAASISSSSAAFRRRELRLQQAGVQVDRRSKARLGGRCCLT